MNLPALSASSLLLASLAVLTGLSAPPAQAANTDTQQVARWFEANRQRPPLLRHFLQRMPKGADLHSHLSGAVYAETYLQLAAQAGLCVDGDSLQFSSPPCTAPQRPASALPGALYSAMVNQLSTRNYTLSGKTGHDQFFATFANFRPVANLPQAGVAMTAEVSNRAASQNIQHLELMTTYQGDGVRKLAQTMPWPVTPDFAHSRQWLLEHGLNKLVEAAREEMDQFDAGYRAAQACGLPQAQPGCRVSIRWLQQTSRTSQPAQVFAQLAYAFELAKADPRVVGINLVAPEDDPVALRDYRLQMAMIGFLSGLMPEVNVALHAGELTLGLVPPETLRHHIHDAVFVAKARRIGHGVGISFEDHAPRTLAEMRQRKIAAEICLTSNEVILGVSGKRHPLPDYLAAGVPVVLASDDEGVSRIDLSHEYQRAAETYRLNYRQLKQLSRNSLEYSFLPGGSLWRNASKQQMIGVCQRDRPGSPSLSPRCAHALGSSEKAQRQWQLEAAFEQFERDPLWRKR